ncbi:MAG: tryptophan synthase subunit alpha [Acidobacteriota bacterium]|nr:tryptophan synthase subunit alpha [Blastocatellia bacterium]MDW8240589.1 tryptophan synthase subunit alpha [Acidobacteriota bacterium]
MGQVACRMNELKRAGRKALIPFLTAGFPSPEIFLRLLRAVDELADLIEIGVPFSDPLADGPVIQRASQMALQQGITLDWILQTLANTQTRAPLVLMSYLNPLLQYVAGNVAAAAHHAQIAGLIVPDLPVEESAPLEAQARDHQLDMIYLVAPTTSAERARYIAERSHGFVYLVSITGVTGARASFPSETFEFLHRMRQVTDRPLCLGFGVSHPRQVERIAPYVDGVIVGSGLLHAIMDAPSDPIRAAQDFLWPIKRALEQAG